MGERAYALSDGNSFYCSCERVFDARLARLPVIVLSNNDGCAIARTAEAKALGIGMGDPWFDLGNLSINHELTADEDALLVRAWLGRAPSRAAVSRVTLMRVVSDFREAMWGVLQQGISDLDVDFRAYATHHFDRMLTNAAQPAFESALRAVADGG